MVAERGQTRAAILKRLHLDVRGFYRDLQLLREVGISVGLSRGKYALEGALDEMVSRLPFPDPHLTLGEAEVLAKGRTAVHRRIKGQLKDVLSE
jgi:predicted DNA-binding transcriptional regulator YafY